MTYVELTRSGWRPEFVSAAVLMSAGPSSRKSLGFVSTPATSQPGHCLQLLIVNVSYQYACKTVYMDVFVDSLGNESRGCVYMCFKGGLVGICNCVVG